MNDNVERLLKLTAFEYCDNIWWRMGHPEEIDGKWVELDRDQVMFLVNCNDVFAWGTADAERIDLSPGSTDLDDLEAAVGEAEAIRGRYRGQDGFILWVARKRGMRPQGAMYPHLDKELWHLFDAAGPARETDILNPKPQPEASV